MREIDVNAIRDPDILLHDLSGADDVYTFYYDETNNIRRLHVTEDGFNVREPMCFVLGGVAHRGPPRPLDVAALKSAVRLQPNAPELKLAHLGKGNLFGLLKSWKVEAYLDWLQAQDLLVHYTAVDPLYWATVDIVDSIISHDRLAHMQGFHRELKADLFTILVADIDDVADLFHRFRYPNVGEANRLAFTGELLQRLEDREERIGEFGFNVLKGVLQAGARDPLIYLQDEEADTLIDSFVDFTIQRICLFKNAQHRLDVEPVIQARLEACAFLDDGEELKTFSFVDSRAATGVQASDAVVGLLGKLFSHIVRTEPAQLVADRWSLTPGQARTLGKLNALLDRSQAENPALLHQVASISALRAGRFFLEGR